MLKKIFGGKVRDKTIIRKYGELKELHKKKKVRDVERDTTHTSKKKNRWRGNKESKRDF